MLTIEVLISFQFSDVSCSIRPDNVGGDEVLVNIDVNEDIIPTYIGQTFSSRNGCSGLFLLFYFFIRLSYILL